MIQVWDESGRGCYVSPGVVLKVKTQNNTCNGKKGGMLHMDMKELWYYISFIAKQSYCLGGGLCSGALCLASSPDSSENKHGARGVRTVRNSVHKAACYCPVREHVVFPVVPTALSLASRQAVQTKLNQDYFLWLSGNKRVDPDELQQINKGGQDSCSLNGF